MRSVKRVRCDLVQALSRLCTGRTAHTGSSVIAVLFLDHGTRRGWGVSVTPLPLFTPRKNTVPIVQGARWAQGRFGQVRKISPPPGFDPQTVQPVASSYTDYTTLTTCKQIPPKFSTLAATEINKFISGRQPLQGVNVVRLFRDCLRHHAKEGDGVSPFNLLGPELFFFNFSTPCK